MPIYKQIFEDSLKLVWRYKHLWILGFFAILFSGSIEGDLYYSFLSNQRNAIYDIMQIVTTGIFNQDILINVQGAFFDNINSSIGLFGVFVGIISFLVVILFLSVASQMIIMRKTSQILRSSKTLSFSFSDIVLGGFGEIKDSIFSASLINVIFKIFIFVLFILITLPIYFSAGVPNVWADFLYILLFVILLPTAIISSLYIKYVVVSLVVNGAGFRRASADAWLIISKNWLLSIEASFLLFLFNIAGILLTMLIISAFAIPLYFLALAAYQLISSQMYVVMIGISYLVIFSVFVFCNAWLSTFNATVWTNLYLKLGKKNIGEKIRGVIGSIIR